MWLLACKDLFPDAVKRAAAWVERWARPVAVGPDSVYCWEGRGAHWYGCGPAVLASSEDVSRILIWDWNLNLTGTLRDQIASADLRVGNVMEVERPSAQSRELRDMQRQLQARSQTLVQAQVRCSCQLEQALRSQMDRLSSCCRQLRTPLLRKVDPLSTARTIAIQTPHFNAMHVFAEFC